MNPNKSYWRDKGARYRFAAFAAVICLSLFEISFCSVEVFRCSQFAYAAQRRIDSIGFFNSYQKINLIYKTFEMRYILGYGISPMREETARERIHLDRLEPTKVVSDGSLGNSAPLLRPNK